MILLSIFTIHRQMKLRAENLEIFSYKRYDFRYRNAGDGTEGLPARSKYEALGTDEENLD